MSGPAPSSILIAGYYGHGNAGDEAILAALLADLRAARPDLAVTVVSGDPARTLAEHGPLAGAVADRDIPALVEAVRSCDLVVVGGGGLFQSYWEVDPEVLLTARHGGLPSYLGYPVLAAWLGKPVVICAVGVGPLPNESGRQGTRVAFEIARRATVRDAESLALLREIGLPAAQLEGIELAADPAFRLPPAGPGRVDGLLAGLGVPAGEAVCAVALRYWDFGVDPAAWEAEVARGLDLFLAEYPGRLLFLPFQRAAASAYEDDLAVHRRVVAGMSRAERAVVVDRVFPPAELAGLLGRCERVLAMRFHAALFALAAEVPVVNLAYDPKTRSLMDQAGLGELSLPAERWTAQAVAAALRRAGEPGRRPPAGFRERMTARAGRGAEVILEALAAAEPPLPESSRFLGEAAVAKILAADRSAADARRLQGWLDGVGRERDAIRDDLDRVEQERDLTGAQLTQTRRERDETGAELARTAQERDTAKTRVGFALRDCKEAVTELERTTQERDELRSQLNGLRESFQRLREQRDLVLAERNGLARRLNEVQETLAYHLVSRFWALMRASFPEGSRRRAFYRGTRRLLGKAVAHRNEPVELRALEAGDAGGAGGDAAAGQDPRGDLLRFEDRVRETGARQVVAILSATLLLESEGQRPTQLALELARRGIPVVFLYWRWWKHEWSAQDRLEEGIVQIPIDVVTERPEMLTAAFTGLERTALFSFPYPGFFDVLAAANAEGWITVYDVLDDWEEFHRVGQAVWYDEPFERHLIRACDAVFAINDFLAARIRELGGEGLRVVGNGLKPGLEVVREPKPLDRGEVTVGYFGYLAGAWFDWELLAAAARRRPGWRFYLIGYGGSPEGVLLPENIVLLGKQPQCDLAAFAANWDVAVIPFKPDRLAAGADPIKTYEYLAMGLPVVVTGVYGPAGGEDFVLRAQGVEEFLDALARAAGAGDTPESTESAARRAFAASCTWGHRLEAILGALERGEQRVAEKRALFGEPAP